MSVSVKKALLTILLVPGLWAFAGSALAHCGGSGTTGTWNGTFWSWFTAGGNNGDDCLEVPRTREGRAYWDLGNSTSFGDAVGGVGWQSGWNAGNLFYNFFTGTWNTTGPNDGWIWFGAYGWSCGAGGGPQEYYIVQSYNAKPAQGTPLGSYRDSSGVTYDAYLQSRNDAMYCPPYRGAFTQYWAIRRSSAGYGQHKIDLSAAMNFWSANGRGFNRNGVGNGYQVIGPEGTNRSRTFAPMRWSVSR